MIIDRKKELDNLLKKLQVVDTNGDTDVDLILSYLEDFLANPTGSGGSKKITEFKIEQSPTRFTREFTLSWIQTFEEMSRNIKQ